jgi:hypothetical protein
MDRRGGPEVLSQAAPAVPRLPLDGLARLSLVFAELLKQQRGGG